MAKRTIGMKLDVDTKKGTAAIKNVKKATSNYSKSAVNDAKKVSMAWNKAGKSFKKISIVVAASAASFTYLAKKSLDAADKIAKLSDSIGISTKLLQEYNYVAGLSGVSTEELSSGLVAFTKRLGEAKTETGALSGYLKNSNKALLDQLKGVDNASQGLDIFMKALGDTENATDRAALAAAAFGRGAGVKMTIMVKDGAGALNLMKQEAHDLGLVLDDELFRNAERLNDDISRLSQVVSTQFTKAILELSPEIEKTTKFMLEWVKANKGLISQKTKEAIDTIRTAINDLQNLETSLTAKTAGVGIVGALLFGGKIGAFIASVYLVNKAIKEMSATAERVAAPKYEESGKLFEKVIEDLEKDVSRINERIEGYSVFGDIFGWNKEEIFVLKEQRAFLLDMIKKYEDLAEVKKEILDTGKKDLDDAKEKLLLAKQELKKDKKILQDLLADKIATAEAWAIYKYDIDQRMLNATGQTYQAELNLLNQKMATEIKEYGLTEDKITEIKEVFGAERKAIDDKYTAKYEANLLKQQELTQSISDQTITIYGSMFEQINLGLQQSGENVKTWGELWVAVGQQANDTLAGAMTDNLWSVVEGTKNGTEAFQDFGKTVIGWLFKMIVKESMLKLLKTGMANDDKKNAIEKLTADKAELAMISLKVKAYLALAGAKSLAGISGGGGGAAKGAVVTPNANGNVFNQGGMAAYANGGVVSTPTNFAFAGGIGLMGEAGAEAIMPLSRTSGGELGVKTEGDQQQPSQTVIINAVDTKSFNDVLQRNPSGIISIVNEALQDRGPILDTIRSTL